MGVKQRRWTTQIDELMLQLVSQQVKWPQIADLIFIKFQEVFTASDVRQRYDWLMGTCKSKTRKYRDNTEY